MRKSTSKLALRIAVGAALVILSIFALAAVLWTQGHSPSDFPTAASAPTTSGIETVRQAGRIVQHVRLVDARLGEIGFTISLPDAAITRDLPVVFVLGALGTGRHSIDLVRNPGSNAIVGYDWPFPQTLKLSHIGALRRSALSIPGQATAVVHWVLAQKWADSNRVSLVGFSLGAVVAPAVGHVMTARGVNVRWTVLADGGAPMSAILRGDREIDPVWLRGGAGLLAELLLRPLEPELHVGQLRGRFLLISSTADTTISSAASERLTQLAPMPKKVIRLPGGHVGTAGAKIVLLEAAINATRSWLVTEGAINRY